MRDLTGTIFEIKELAVFDGPGIRTTVFFKGCPLRCQWCHNPEGLSGAPQLMVSPNGCRDCGRCRAACTHGETGCVLCGDCVRACPERLRRICGDPYTPDALAARLLRDRDYLAAQGGGITFSGGEPTMQGDFLLAVLDRLNGMHTAIETCGHCDPALFRRLLERLDYVMLDIKLANAALHRRYTGVDNALILENLAQLKASGKPFVVRIPVIPGVNDSLENLRDTAQLLTDAPALEKVELLPYHRTAGAKYGMVGLEYRPDFSENAAPLLDASPFTAYGLPCQIL